MRRKLPDERQAITHKFDIAGHEGYITVGLFEDGMPGEIFLVMAKEGSTISGFADAFAQAISYALQYGVPLQALVDKFSHVRFEPSGMTKNPDVRFAKSIVDYIFRWMASKFLSPEAQFRAGVNNRDEAIDGADRGARAEGGAARRPRRSARPASIVPSDVVSSPRCRTRKTRRRARPAARSWCAAAPATSAATAARRAAARKTVLRRQRGYVLRQSEKLTRRAGSNTPGPFLCSDLTVVDLRYLTCTLVTSLVYPPQARSPCASAHLT